MKLKIVVVLVLALTLLTGCGKTVTTLAQNDQGQTLMEVDALKAIAYEHAGVDAADVFDVDGDWDQKGGKTLYELEFKVPGVEYEYGLDGYTGVVVYSTYEGEPVRGGEEWITEEAAKKAALSHAGVSEEQAERITVRPDREDGIYEVEFYVSGIEYDYEISAISGEVVQFEKEPIAD